MKRIYLTFIVVLCTFCCFAQKLETKDSLRCTDPDSMMAMADSAYAKDRYKEAEKIYLKLAAMGESSKVCYNLGNVYFREDSMAKAVLWYERAAKLDPSNDDISFNLDFARSKTIDRITPEHELFFISFWRDMMHKLSVTQWAWMSLGTFILMLVLILLYVFEQNIIIRKVSFYVSVLCLFTVLIGNVMAWSLRSENVNRTCGIVMSPAVTVKSTPARNGTDLFVIHEGTKVEVLDSTKEWAQVRIADGRSGWLEKRTFENI